MCILSRFDNEKDTSRRYDYLMNVLTSFEKDIKPIMTMGAMGPQGAPGRDAPKRVRIVLASLFFLQMLGVKQEINKIEKQIVEMKVQVTKNYSEQGRCDIKLKEQRDIYLNQLHAQTISTGELPKIPGTTEDIEKAP